MFGKEGKCLSNKGEPLRVTVHSEVWNAQSSISISPGERIKVIGIDGLILKVEPIR
jgi:membrane-bound serine protease (ClpP class)